MVLNSLNIVNFKNIAECRAEFCPGVNCLIGNNAMGKTNMLDAIHYLSYAKSYARVVDGQVVRHGQDYMMLRGDYTRSGDPTEITMAYRRGHRKTLKRDGKEYQRLSQHIGLLPLVMVSPVDSDIVRGTSEYRRRLMDLVISQNSPDYLDALIRYNKAVENRNTLIRSGYRDPLLYESVERQLCAAAAVIRPARQHWITEFTPIFTRYYQAIAGSGETVEMTLTSHLDLSGDMASVLSRNHDRDMALGYTSAGLHRDDIALTLAGAPMRTTGSQGQCKTYTIALRLAQYDFIRSKATVRPLLLLDDIFDKLDAQRVERIVQLVSSRQFGQIFITDTDRAHLTDIVGKIDGPYRIFNVTDGNCHPE